MNNSEIADVIVVTCEYPPFPGGIGTYSGEMVKALRAKGKKVFVIAPAYPDLPVMQNEQDVMRILGHHSIPIRAVPKLVSYLRKAPKNAIVLAADIRTVMLLYVTKWAHGRSYRVMVHGSEASKLNGNGLLFKVARRAYLTADIVAYNSRSTGATFRDAAGSPKREAVTYLGVDPSWFSAPSTGSFENPALRELSEGVSIFCSIGRIEERKGQMETVRALAIAKQKYGLSDAIYVIAGRVEDQVYVDDVRKIANELGVEVIIPGRLSYNDLKRLLRRASSHLLFAQPLLGRIEGFGLVLLEAAAQGCPSITSDTGGIPEVLGDTGVIIDANDLDGFARQIAEGAKNPNLKEERGGKAHDRAKNFTWDSCVEATFPELSH